MHIPQKRILLWLVLALVAVALTACSKGKKVNPEISQIHAFAPALSPAERLIQFVDTGRSYLLNGIFSDSILTRMSVNEMVQTRNDFVKSFGKLLRAEGPNFDSDSTATVILYHEDMTLAASLKFDKQGLIKDISINQDLSDEQLGAF
jgi:hypothetical protein